MGLDRIGKRESGLLLYGFTPPKLGTDGERLAEISRRRASRLETLPVDAKVVYDVQDESSRNPGERPYPFSPTISAVDYARDWLPGEPAVIYLPAASHDRESLSSLVRTLPAGQALVLVGSPARGGSGLSLEEAYAAVSGSGARLLLGGVSIPERHARKGDEHERVMRKSDKGCAFFVSQCAYDLGILKDYLSDYAYACSDAGREPAYQVVTLTVCGSPKTLEFMEWLGISVPRWLKNDLRRSPDILSESIEACAAIAAEAASFCEGKRIPFGFNIESLSNRKVEIEASVELARRVAAVLGRS